VGETRQVAMQLYKATKDQQYMVWSATANVLQATSNGQPQADDKLLTLAEALLQRQLTFAPSEAKEETLRLMLHVLDLRRSPAAALQLLQVGCARVPLRLLVRDGAETTWEDSSAPIRLVSSLGVRAWTLADRVCRQMLGTRGAVSPVWVVL